MPVGRSRARFAAFHRWVGLVTSPLFMIILVSGLVLAVIGRVEPPSARVDAGALSRTLSRVDPREEATSVRVDAASGLVSVRGIGGPSERVFDIASAVERTPADMPADTEGFWINLHARMGGVGDGPVKIVTLLITAVVLIGPFLARPRGVGTVMGRHVLLGWMLFPLAALTPVTGAMLALHIGDPGGIPRFDRTAAPVSPESAVRFALQANVDLSGLVSIDRFHGGPATLTVWEMGERTTRIVDSSGTATRVSTDNWVKSLHEGSWAEPWSRLVAVASVLSLIYLLAGGIRSWARRRLFSGARGGRRTAITGGDGRGPNPFVTPSR